VLLLLLALALVLAVVIIVLPLVLTRRAKVSGRQAGVCFVYFGLLGLAFLLVEIPLLQRFILYLGNPAYAMSTSLFALLLFSGIGSLYARHVPQRRALAVLILVILVAPGCWWLFELTWVTHSHPARDLGIALPRWVSDVIPSGGIQQLEGTAAGLISGPGVNGFLSVISDLAALTPFLWLL
jgi:hypothetical protein